MIKDLIVNLATGAERDPARDYALTIAEAFGAHIVGMAFAYEHVLPGYVLGELPAELVTEAMLWHQKAAEAVVERFDADAKRGPLSAEHIVNKVLARDAPVVLASAARRFDLSVVMQSEPDGVDNDRLIEGLLFESSRPVNIVPYIQRDGLSLDRVVCCWDGSRPAARAINDALSDQNKTLGRISIKTYDLLGADNVATAGGGQRARCCLINNPCLETGRIGYFPNCDNYVSWRFALCLKTFNAYGTGNYPESSVSAIIKLTFISRS